MKLLKSLFFMFAAMAAIVSCSKETPVKKYLDVTPNNISGEWKLVEYNGAALEGDTYFYIEFIRKDGEYVIYQNFDSMGQLPHKVTGRFRIYTDQVNGAIISGDYDFDGGLWSYEYDVNNLTETTMDWLAISDDSSFEQKFERCQIPEGIKSK